jgi:hypothetical protein
MTMAMLHFWLMRGRSEGLKERKSSSHDFDPQLNCCFRLGLRAQRMAEPEAMVMAAFKPPTSEELALQAAKIGLPEKEAQMFYCYYASKGWKVGKHSMTHWRIALTGWKLRWEAARGEIKPSVQMMIYRDELKAIEARMNDIRNSYSEHQTWSSADVVKFNALKARKAELMKLLGMQV